LEKVWQGFNNELFKALLPGFPQTRILRFDGCNVGDEVHTELHFLGIKQRFDARIITRRETANEYYFIDEGIKLPFFLTYWQHKHIVSRLTINSCIITDEIHYALNNNVLAEAFLWPVIYAQLFLRKPIYKKHFHID